ncbi:hypothetical protein CPAV1605_1121 [seawater metagenome]|uniref:Uncharacterized protein n=1 Tax=seawater metagenome TaxID=1561972 RepID=A0A5E8CMG7_9ZZZZ
MSQEILHQTKPIQIATPNRYAYSLPISDFNRYLFELKIKLNKKNKLIRKIEDSKKVQLISKDDKISFNDLKKFNIKVHVLPDDNIEDLELEGKIDSNTNNFTRSTNKLYLEFLRTDTDYVECNCNVIFTDTFKYSVSPPF